MKKPFQKEYISLLRKAHNFCVRYIKRKGNNYQFKDWYCYDINNKVVNLYVDENHIFARTNKGNVLDMSYSTDLLVIADMLINEKKR